MLKLFGKTVSICLMDKCDNANLVGVYYNRRYKLLYISPYPGKGVRFDLRQYWYARPMTVKKLRARLFGRISKKSPCE